MLNSTLRRFASFVFVWSVCVVGSCLCGTAIAQDAKQDERLKMQGEYVGNVLLDGNDLRIGINLIAGSDDQFTIKVYFDGLPGDGAEAAQETDNSITEKMVDGVLEFQHKGQRGVVENGVFKFYEADKLVGELKRVERESETLGMAPPEGAIVLFDGTSGEQFESRKGKEFFVDGLLQQGIISKQKFGGDFTLHIEFKLPFEPNKSGQGRGNSGVYLQGRYEVQMLDSFGLAGEHNECGGIYSIKKPDINMCYPPETWQTYDIEFKSAKWDGDNKTENARMTVRHNGHLIHDDVELPKITTAAPLKESAEPGYLYLQDHGSPVRYRNIWVKQNDDK